jgi:hypothetical protein
MGRGGVRAANEATHDWIGIGSRKLLASGLLVLYQYGTRLATLPRTGFIIGPKAMRLVGLVGLN